MLVFKIPDFPKRDINCDETYPSLIDKLEIKIDNGPVRLYLIDSNGRLIKEIINKNLTSGIHRIRYNASKLKNGLYFIKLQNNKSQFSRSIIKYN